MATTAKGETGRVKSDEGNNRRAVVDIGSNSVRLVIFDGPPRAPMAICNEKALCGLGRDIGDDGALNPDAVADAIATLKRFRLVLNAYGSPPTQTIATAAVRAARDGDVFVGAAKALGYDVKVITGEEEAELAALGVVSVEPDAKGLVGDMGGGSLELMALKKRTLADAISLPIGPLTIMRETGADLAAAEKLIRAALDEAAMLKKASFDTLYTVGGAWRSLARIHMNLKHYPLSVLHHYELEAATAIEVCDLVARQSRRSLEEIPGISRKRVDTLPFAAIALKALLAKINAQRIIVSAGGVREGLLYKALGEKERKTDPLLAACALFARRFAPEPEFGAAALKVIEPLFKSDKTVTSRILAAASELSDIAAFSHPDMRGRQAFDTALSAPFVSVTHKDRVWIALALWSRYCGRSAMLPNEQAISILGWEEQQSATQAGLALRFAATLAPKTPSLLEGCALALTKDGVEFSAPENFKELIGETPRKRLDALAAAFETQAYLTFAA